MEKRSSSSDLKIEPTKAKSAPESTIGAEKRLDVLPPPPRGVAVAQVAPAVLRKPFYLSAQRICAARREADRITNIEGFSASRAFDTLLDLYITAATGQPVCVSSARSGTAVPIATALRWIHVLEQEGLVSRSPDPHDQSRAYLTLTRQGTAKIEEAIACYAF